MSATDKDDFTAWIPPTIEELHALLPQYEISAMLGRGGMGAVYQGRQIKLMRNVAIKILPESFSDADDHFQFVERFNLEAQSMANLDHPAILSVYDFGETSGGQLYLVMEFIDGMEIEKYLHHHGGKLLPAHAISIAADPRSGFTSGDVVMGSPAKEKGRRPEEAQAPVELSRGFWIGSTEVTQGQYQAVIGSNPSYFKGLGPQAPVEQVTWGDAIAYCHALTRRERDAGTLPKGWIYTLPTEAQWEYACRAGGDKPFGGQSADDISWHQDNSDGKPHVVAQQKANPWGLYDMHGNLWEWCLDWFQGELPGGRDPSGPAQGEQRSHRGGCWFAKTDYLRAASRGRNDPQLKNSRIGFRVVITPEKTP